ncbi:MAG: capsid protein [Mesorhizobium sp.]|nr:MAG: capsid protein [Mesorhizobium sp.]
MPPWLARETSGAFGVAVTPSPRTLRAELLRLCARIGYSPPARL